MQIQAVNNVRNAQNFGTIYASGPELSKRQEVIAKKLAKEFRVMKSYLQGATLENHYRNKGYDFIVTPYGDELVSLDAYKMLKIEKTDQGKVATYIKHDGKHIGNYDLISTGYLADDLMYSFNKIV